MNAPIRRICIENPVGALTNHSKLGKATQYVQPYEFGHGEQKRTGFWLKGLPKLTPTHILPTPERDIGIIKLLVDRTNWVQVRIELWLEQ